MRASKIIRTPHDVYAYFGYPAEYRVAMYALEIVQLFSKNVYVCPICGARLRFAEIPNWRDRYENLPNYVDIICKNENCSFALGNDEHEIFKCGLYDIKPEFYMERVRKLKPSKSIVHCHKFQKVNDKEICVRCGEWRK